MNFILIGLPGIGKSTISKLLADKLTWGKIETDKELVKNYEQIYGEWLNTRSIYRKIGEIAFRQLENKILLQFLGVQNCVFDIGGGALDYPANQKLLKALGKMVYLKTTDVDMVFERLMQKGVPSYLDFQDPFQSFLELVQKRLIIYEQAADLIIDVEKESTTENLVNLILRKENLWHPTR